MALHFVKLTSMGGKPIYINGDQVAAVHEDLSSPTQTDTLVIMTGTDTSYYRVKESIETVTDLLYNAMQE